MPRFLHIRITLSTLALPIPLLSIEYRVVYGILHFSANERIENPESFINFCIISLLVNISPPSLIIIYQFANIVNQNTVKIKLFMKLRK